MDCAKTTIPQAAWTRPLGIGSSLYSNSSVAMSGKLIGEMGHQRMASVTMAATYGKFSRSGNEGRRSVPKTWPISS
jgi:hypothetical protein